MSRVGFLLRPRVGAARGAAITGGARRGQGPVTQGPRRHAERRGRDPGEADQPGDAQPGPHPFGVRGPRRHPEGHPDRVHVERHRGRHVTSTNAPKLASLRRNPAVALTIDTEVHPPKILLLRGGAVLDEVEGIPDEYLQMNGSYEMTPEQRVVWRPRSGPVRLDGADRRPADVGEAHRLRRDAAHRRRGARSPTCGTPEA